MNLLDFISRNSEQDRQDALLAKSADYFMQAGGDQAYSHVGVTKDGWKNLSAKERVGAVQGVLQAAHYQKFLDDMEAEKEQRQFRREDQQMQRTTFADQQGQTAAAQRFMETLGTGSTGAPPDQGADPESFASAGAAAAPKFDPATFIQAAQKSGYRLPPHMIEAMMKESEGTDWNAVMPRPFEIDGVKGAVGKSGQFQFLPQATPETMQAIPVYDDAGNIVAQRVPTGKGGSAPLPAARQPRTLPDAYNSRLATLQDQLDQHEGALNKTDDELAALKVGKPAEVRSRYQARAAATKKEIANHVERYAGQGYADPDFWNQERSRLGLSGSTNNQAPSSKPKSTAEKMKLANDLAKQHPDWPRSKIIEAVNAP